MTSIAEKHRLRFQFLDLLYDKTEGSELEMVNMWDMGEELGWDEGTTRLVVQYLVGEGLARILAIGGGTVITHLGVQEVERARSQPDRPTALFPAHISKTTGDTFQLSGDFRGAVVNIKSTLTDVSQTIESIPSDYVLTRDRLEQLVEQLNDVLQRVPASFDEDAEAVAEYARELIENATEARPNRARLRISADGLKKAAENLEHVLPTVVRIATQIASVIHEYVANLSGA